MNTEFNKNKAWRLGGGGIYSKDGKLVLVGLWGEMNSAPTGGGGMIYWDSVVPPVFAPWCPEGSWGKSESGTASQCANGTYQTGCIACPSGTYNNLTGQLQCLACPAGTFSTGLSANGIDDCELCSAGTFSVMAATTCVSCPAETYANTTGASLCVQGPTDARARQFYSANITLSILDPGPSHATVRLSNRKSQTSKSARSQRGSCSPGVTRGKNCSKPPAVSKRDRVKSEGLEVVCRSKLFQISFNTIGLQKSICTIPGAVDEANSNSWNLQRSIQTTSRLSYVSTTKSSGWCGMGNVALYGNCIASAFKKLDILDPLLPVYAGISFTIAVHKLDAYNQTISADSTSVLQVHPSSTNDNALSTIFGPEFVQLQVGIAEFTIAVKLSFARIDAQLRISDLLGEPKIFFDGSDSIESLSDSRMVSGNFIIPVFVGDHVCPLGYILKLDEMFRNARSGICSFCAEGTYSMYPLFEGSDTVSPACVSCPIQALQNNDCAKGGGTVNFSLGTWRVSDGLYTLVACPAGYQMINTIDGIFSNQAQQCSLCGPGYYIINSSNANYSCQPCPEFLVCDGAQISSRYSGALITVDYANGVYQLSGCPPGFEIISDFKDCTICAELFYCSGGIAAKVPCPPETFSSAGSNSSSYCVVSVFLSLAVSLPISVQQFDIATQKKFVLAMSIAADIAVDRVIFVSVAPSSTGRSIGSIIIQANLAVEDRSTATRVVSDLDETTLNDALVTVGLPKGQILTISDGNSVIVVANSWNAGLIATVIIALLVLAAGVLMVWLRYQTRESEEEQLLRIAIDDLRKLLGIRKQDGFYLSSELGPLWRQRNRTIFILRNEMEAAARLSLTHDFDIKSFDAFCHCIEHSSFVLNCIESSRSILHGGEAKKPMSQPLQYDALCDWLLEVSKKLIEPEILKKWQNGRRPTADEDFESGMLESERQDAAKKHVTYFKHRVARVSLWADHDRRLWQRLKLVATDYMGEMARLCDTRFDPHRQITLLSMGTWSLIRLDTRQIRADVRRAGSSGAALLRPRGAGERNARQASQKRPNDSPTLKQSGVLA